MKNRLLLLSLCLTAATLALPGCSKVKKLLHLKSAETVVAVAAATPAATPTPAPEEPPATTANRNAGVIVLCYHRFEDLPKDYLAIKPSEFEEQMQAVKDNGFTVIPMQDFLAWRRGEKEIPAKSAIITIDDGYLSGYEVAWPILKKFNYPFTMFIYIQYIGSGGKSITWDQLAEMRDAGVDIECHTYSHQNLHGHGLNVNKQAAQEIAGIGYDAWLKKEISDSRQTLEKQLGIKANVFAYPYGVYNSRVREVVKEAGYEAAFTVYGQRINFSTPPFDLIGRYAISSREPKIFQSAMGMIGGGQIVGSEPAAPAMAQLAAASMATEPMQDETISDPKPLIKANLATMGAIDPASVVMRISGFGPVPAKYDESTKTISFQVTTQPLREKNYTVIIDAKVGGKRAETSWSFNFDPSAPAASPAAAPAAVPAKP